MAKRFGADHVIDFSERDENGPIAEVRAVAPSDGVDGVIEVCGQPVVIPAGLKMLRVGGLYILGTIVASDADVTVDATLFFNKWISLRRVYNYHPRHLPQTLAIQALDFVVTERDRVRFGEIAYSTFKLEDLNEAHARASDRSVLRAAGCRTGFS